MVEEEASENSFYSTHINAKVKDARDVGDYYRRRETISLLVCFTLFETIVAVKREKVISNELYITSR